ncbi:MAG: hypothetical protein NC253_15020 [Ruminococcus sp.]|nr:hypothetical protein [Ruminococcus sp.]MCM1382084.1 hypothetical protein [Muribaculaceae bacterium]
MIIKLNTQMAKEIMRKRDRDYFSEEALDRILEFYDEIGENIVFDVYAVCGEWEEAAPEDFLRYYDNRLEPDELGLSDNEKVEILIERCRYDCAYVC